MLFIEIWTHGPFELRLRWFEMQGVRLESHRGVGNIFEPIR